MTKQAPLRGTADLLPARSEAMLGLYLEAHELARRYGFRYVETPAIEHTELFVRTSGETSDVVTKEMYSFEDKGGRSITLRPEPTAGVVRAYLSNRQELPNPFKAYYIGLQWRHSRPQAGRLREFRQFGIETLGTAGPAADAEVVVLADRYLRARGLTKLSLQLNSIGDETCRPAYRELLLGYLRANRERLRDEHGDGFEKNPLRVLDCKDEACRAVTADAPRITDHLCEECRGHFGAVQALLADEGVAYELDSTLVRGLDYYTRTAFEFVSEALPGQQGTVCGGGRYDGLAEVLGGEPTPGVGFGMGLDRVLLALEGEGAALPAPRTPEAFVVAIGGDAERVALDLVRSLRAEGVAADAAHEARPLKAQLKMADHAGAAYALIVGEREVADRTVTARRLADGEQQTIAIGDVVAWISRRR
jgi:histidyl-tRNA synthetase